MSDSIDENAAATDLNDQADNIGSAPDDSSSAAEKDDFFGSGEAAQIEAPSTESEVSSLIFDFSSAPLKLSYCLLDSD